MKDKPLVLFMKGNPSEPLVSDMDSLLDLADYESIELDLLVGLCRWFHEPNPHTQQHLVLSLVEECEGLPLNYAQCLWSSR